MLPKYKLITRVLTLNIIPGANFETLNSFPEAILANMIDEKEKEISTSPPEVERSELSLPITKVIVNGNVIADSTDTTLYNVDLTTALNQEFQLADEESQVVPNRTEDDSVLDRTEDDSVLDRTEDDRISVSPTPLNLLQRQEKAELLFKRMFKPVVIDGDKRTQDKKVYQDLFLRTTKLATLDSGLHAVIDQINSLLHQVMTMAKLDLTDSVEHFSSSWFAMNIVTILEYQKPGFFTLMRPKNIGMTDEYVLENDAITSARIKEVARLLRTRFLNYCDDKTVDCSIRKVGVNSKKRKANSNPTNKTTPGKKCRRGKNPNRSYCHVNFTPGMSPVIENMDTDESKQLIENLLRKCGASQWQENCPVLFTDGLARLEQFTEWSYEPNGVEDGVTSLDLITHQSTLGPKLRDLVRVVKSYCVQNNYGFTTLVDDDKNLDGTLAHVTTTGIKEEQEIIVAIRVLGKITSAGRSNITIGHTISVHPERKIAGCAIHIKIQDGRLVYTVSIEGTELFPTTSIMEAIKAFFLITMAANVVYHNGSTCFGFIMEHCFYGRPQTGKISPADLKAYNGIKKFWNSMPSVATKLPDLFVNPKKVA